MKKTKLSKQRNLFNNFSKKMVYSFLIFHLLASQVFLPYFGKKEIFPIFNWSLFSSCNEIKKAIPEIEIFFEGGDKITSKQFSRKLAYKSLFYMDSIFRVQDQRQKDQLLNELLYLISHSVNESTFKYKVFRSDIRLVEYMKSHSLKKEVLYKEGLFKRNPKK